MSSKEQLLKDALNVKEIQQFVVDNNISVDTLDMNLLSLVSYSQKIAKCKNCKGLSSCKQDTIGYMPILDYNEPNIYVDFKSCPFRNNLEEKVKKESNLITLACNLDDISPTKLIVSSARNNALRKLANITAQYLDNKPVKGLYLYGYYGCGKTYIISVTCLKLASEGKKVVFAYYPDLVRQIKSYIGTSKFEKTIDLLKNADVLVLDDFGGEVSTAFIRDEILGPVLQERMTNKSLTFITSNLDYDTIKQHLEDTKDGSDHVKAGRIMERIESLMDFEKLDDKNYRHNN